MYKRILALVAAAVLVASSAQAAPSVEMVWRGVGATLVSPAASTTATADIVLMATTETVQGVFISIEFDATELQVVGAAEFAGINLPSMGNEFSPIFFGTTTDNEAGLVTLFDEVTLATGLVAGNMVTLGSVTFHVVAATGAPSDIDVIASVQNPGIDSLSLGNTVYCQSTNPTGCDFVGARVTPEPTTALLLIAGIAGLGYVGRRPRS